MKPLIFLLTSTMLLLISVNPVHAQFEKNAFKIHGGVSLPLSDFGSKNEEYGGYAKTGLGIGLEYSSAIGSSGLKSVTSMTFISNKCDISDEFNYGTEVNSSSWINVPVLTGLKYQTTESQVDFYVLGQVGVNFVQAPSMKISNDGISVMASYNAATSFGFAVGGGLIIGKDVSIGLKYLNLGQPKIEGTVESSGTLALEINYEEKQPISILLLVLNFNFL